MKYVIGKAPFDTVQRIKFPKAITYVDGLVTVTGEMPADYQGEVSLIYDLDVTMEALATMVEGYLLEEPRDKLVVLSQTQGDWMLFNHPDFKSKHTEGDI